VPFPAGIRRRDFYVDKIVQHLRRRRAVLLSGLRRVGKSTIMRLVAQRLIEAGTSPRDILYVSVDDYLLRNTTILDIVAAFRTIHAHSVDHPITLLLDEVTAQQDFHQQAKTLIDREDVQIVAGASSASLLRDRKAYLTGRTTAIEVQPLTFFEYLDFQGITVPRRDAHLLDGHFRTFVRTGGLPEHVIYPSRDYLMSLVDDVIQKDIAAFHGLKDHQIIRDYFSLLMERSGKQVSVNRLGRIVGLSPDTARRYLSYFEETFLIHLVPRHGKTNGRILSPKKVYACDLGVKHLFVGDRDWGGYFENYVYLRIRAYRSVSYVLTDRNELDFLTDDGTLIEAKYNATLEGTQKEAFDRFPASRKAVIQSVRDLPAIERLWDPADVQSD
jgi:uncharacterized protein